ncbi:HofP DNA utilization family protein [Kluyvera sp. NPDC087067]|uniref:HofP DNA utilization family protein n=1 Tax=Kluyvera sp. NPDC087067 TaxID=3364105 RepID=UPI00382DF41A
MMNINCARFLLLITPLLCGMRDPFAPMADRCHTAELSQWHYRGIAQSSGRLIGFVQMREGKWLRVEQGQTINSDWLVSGMTPESLSVEAGQGCEPQRWQWKREGTKHDKKDEPADTAGVAAIGSGEKHHAGGGRRPGGAGATKSGRP